MFDIDSGKLLIVAVLALIVIGPKELPRVLRQFGQAVGKMRRMASEFQGQFMDAMKEADIADIRKELNELNSSAALDFNFDPARDIQNELTGVMQPAAPVVAETTVASPMEGFVLPAVIEPAETGEAILEGVAPLIETHSAAEAASDAALAQPALNGADTAADFLPGPKRRIRVKRRRSTFNVVRGEQAASLGGEALIVRQRAVRPKPLVENDAPPA